MAKASPKHVISWAQWMSFKSELPVLVLTREIVWLVTMANLSVVGISTTGQHKAWHKKDPKHGSSTFSHFFQNSSMVKPFTFSMLWLTLFTRGGWLLVSNNQSGKQWVAICQRSAVSGHLSSISCHAVLNQVRAKWIAFWHRSYRRRIISLFPVFTNVAGLQNAAIGQPSRAAMLKRKGIINHWPHHWLLFKASTLDGTGTKYVEQQRHNGETLDDRYKRLAKKKCTTALYVRAHG